MKSAAKKVSAKKILGFQSWIRFPPKNCGEFEIGMGTGRVCFLGKIDREELI